MATVPTVTLSSGQQMPVIGLGTFDNLKNDPVTNAVKAAIDVGYRLIDCAWIYRSEAAVGAGIADRIEAGVVTREDLFIQSKLWNTFHEPERVELGLLDSLRDLRVDYLDLYLMHWPMSFKEQQTDKQAWVLSTQFQPADIDFVDTWRAMEKLVDKGLVKSIGISNFNVPQLRRLLEAPGLRYKPVYMQLETHPLFLNQELIDFCQSQDIVVTAFSPLAKGGSEYAGKPTENVLENPIVKQVASVHNRTPAQVVLRWCIERGLCIVPKSCTPARIKENFQIFDFSLSQEEIKAISLLNKDKRVVTLEVFKNFPEYPF